MSKSSLLQLLLLTLHLASPADAYARLATAVTGEVVKDAANLTMGGRVGTYTVLLQVLNPEYGPLRLLMQCCGEYQNLVYDMVTKVNAHEVYGPKGANKGVKALKTEYAGKCKELGIRELLQQGKPECSYLYEFQNRVNPDNTFTAWSVPEEMCATDMGGSRGLVAGYAEYLQTMNMLYGDLVFAGKGSISSVLNGMDAVNEGNLTRFQFEKPKFLDLFGVKIPIGKSKFMKFPGIEQLGAVDMLSACDRTPHEGILYVFENRLWSNSSRDLNVTEFLADRRKRLSEEKLKELKQRMQMVKQMLSERAPELEKKQEFLHEKKEDLLKKEDNVYRDMVNKGATNAWQAFEKVVPSEKDQKVELPADKLTVTE